MQFALRLWQKRYFNPEKTWIACKKTDSAPFPCLHDMLQMYGEMDQVTSLASNHCCKHSSTEKNAKDKKEQPFLGTKLTLEGEGCETTS